MKDSWFCALACVGLLAAASLAKADEWNKRTVVTFNEPVEIPGIVLLPGTYVMKLADSPSDRDVVQVFNQREDRVYATVMAIPVYRDKPTSHTVITFEERRAGVPEAIKDWYYPGDLRGQEFVYPHDGTVIQTASVTPLSAPAPAPAAPAVAPRPVPAPAPAPQPTEISQATPPSSHPSAPQATPAKKTQSAKVLPKTASSLPLIGLVGMISIALGLGLRKRTV